MLEGLTLRETQAKAWERTARRAAATTALNRLWRLGVSALTDKELLSVLLGNQRREDPVHGLADSLLEVGGGLRTLAQHDPHELCSLTGIKPARAGQLLAALELGRRALESAERRPRLLTPHEVHRYLWPRISSLRREVFHVLCLNARSTLVRDARVAEGTVNTCPVDPREVFGAALSARATAIIVAHNHPSGDLEISRHDRALTSQLCRGAHLLGIRLLDHVVVGGTGYASFAEQGLPLDES